MAPLIGLLLLLLCVSVSHTLEEPPPPGPLECYSITTCTTEATCTNRTGSKETPGSAKGSIFCMYDCTDVKYDLDKQYRKTNPGKSLGPRVCMSLTLKPDKNSSVILRSASCGYKEICDTMNTDHMKWNAKKLEIMKSMTDVSPDILDAEDRQNFMAPEDVWECKACDTDFCNLPEGKKKDEKAPDCHPGTKGSGANGLFGSWSMIIIIIGTTTAAVFALLY